MMVQIIKATAKEVETTAQLALQLWPENNLDELSAEFSALLTRSDTAVFLEVHGDTSPYMQNGIH